MAAFAQAKAVVLQSPEITLLSRYNEVIRQKDGMLQTLFTLPPTDPHFKQKSEIFIAMTSSLDRELESLAEVIEKLKKPA